MGGAGQIFPKLAHERIATNKRRVKLFSWEKYLTDKIFIAFWNGSEFKMFLHLSEAEICISWGVSFTA